ncbi:MAG: RDD family protein [Victivallaceae bacterium]|nr:RDD family protein [Victivallaceae bacterium]MDD4180806.1 RDD family protein [Victivallaceae bacterium]
MKYIVKIADAEYGPVDELTLLKWIDEDRINRDTEITSKLIKDWRKASELDFLKKAITEQNARFKAEGIDGYAEQKETAWKRFKVFIWGKTEDKAFVMAYKPDFARLSARFNAFCFDFFILALVFVLFAMVGIHSAFKYAASNTASTELAGEDNLIRKVTEALTPPKNNANEKIVEEKVTSENALVTDNKALLKDTVKDFEDKADDAARKVFGKLHEKIKTSAQVPRINLDSVNVPTIFADSSAGYKIGHRWVNTADHNRHYVCLSATEENARWIKVSKLGYFFTFAMIAWLPILLLYYGISLGYFAQSPGMWYFGLFICNRDQKETYFFRAFCFTILMLLFGILMPLFVLACKRGAHDLLCGVYVYSIVAKTPN